MTNYRQSGYGTGQSLKVAKSYIPEESVHLIDFPGTQLVTWGNVYGTAEFGDKIRLEYKIDATSTVIYTYFPSTDLVYGRAEFSGFLPIDSVRGTCKLIR